MIASTLSLSSAYENSVFSVIYHLPPFFFHLKSFLLKDPLTVKVRKEIINQILDYNSLCFEIRAHLSHLFAWTHKINKFNRWSCSKNEPNTLVKTNIYCANQILCEKLHKKWNQECKLKQSLSFNFCNIFDLLTCKTPKIAWLAPVFKPNFYIFPIVLAFSLPEICVNLSSKYLSISYIWYPIHSGM